MSAYGGNADIPKRRFDHFQPAGLTRYDGCFEPWGLAMRRRDFINAVALAAAVWPLSVRAQQPAQVRRIGVLMNIAENDPEAAVQVAALVQALKERGWIVGTNIQIDYRWAAGDSNLYRK